jgi:beta-glucosidase
VQPARDLTNFDEATKAYAVDPGVFELQLGASSADIRARKTLSVN